MAHPEFRDRSFAHLRLGALPPREDPRTLQFDSYLLPEALPPIPKSYAFLKGVPSWPMYGNDRLGDCTVAASGHMIEAWTQAAGRLVVPDGGAVEVAYWETGRPPSSTGSAGGPTDDGRVEIDVLNYWRRTGIGGDKIGAYVAVNPRNAAHVKAAIYLFGGVYVGIAMPISAQRQTKWTVVPGPTGAPGSWGGHAVPILGYTASTYTLVTWGSPLVMTSGFNSKYTGEAYAILSPDFLNETGHSPAGFDLAALQADLQAISG